MDFHCTLMGKKYYESTIPSIAKALEKLAKKKTTYAISTDIEHIAYVINKESESGSRFVEAIKTGEYSYVIVFEKEVNNPALSAPAL